MPPVSMARMKRASVRKLRCSAERGDAVGAAPEVGAIDLDRLPGDGVSIDHDESPRDRAAVRLGIKAEVLARQTLPRGDRLDVVHDGVRLGLFVETAVAPVLADVIGLALGGEIIALDHGARRRHQAQHLGEGRAPYSPSTRGPSPSRQARDSQRLLS